MKAYRLPKAAAVLTAAMTLVAGFVLASQPARGAVAPAAGDPPIMFIHGFDPLIPGTVKDCHDVWGDAEQAIRDSGWTGPEYTFGLYSTSANCDNHYDGTQLSSITDLGKAVAWNIYNHYSKNGEAIDVITHSMGGLVIRAAIAGVAEHKGGDGWPPYVNVANVATLGAPHNGANQNISDALCGSEIDPIDQQCLDMQPNSPFLLSLPRNPQGQSGTDWTLIGSVADTVVDYSSEIDEIHEGSANDWAHRLYYPDSVGFSHYDLRKVVTGTYDMVYRNGTGPDVPTTGPSPVIAALRAISSSDW